MTDTERLDNVIQILIEGRDNHDCGEDDETCFCNDFDLILDKVKELRIKLIDEQIAHLEAMLPSINDRHEYAGTVEVIERLEAGKDVL